jgi:hypothetical protein
MDRPIARGVVRFFRWPDEPLLEAFWRGGLVFLFAPSLVIAALCLLNVVELRPGEPPPGLLPKLWAVGGLAALAVLMLRLAAQALARVSRR